MGQRIDSTATTGWLTLGIKTTGTAHLSDSVAATARGNFVVNGAKLGSAGSIKLGNINLNVGTAQTLEHHVTQDAPQNGNITIGNVTVNAGVKAAISLSLANHASASNADVRDGNVTVGNVSMQAAASAFILAHIGNYANVLGGVSGNATVENVTVGNVSLFAGAGGTNALQIDDDAAGDNAADTTGLVKVGNVTAAAATKADVSIDILNNAATKAYDGSGKIPLASGSAGGISVGNISLAVGASGSADVKILDHGVTAGNQSVGNIDLHAATSAVAAASLTNEAATKVGNTTVGNTTVGNVTEAGAVGFFSIFNAALAGSKANHDPNGNATAGHVTVGNVSMSGVQNAFAATNAAEAYAVKGSAVANGVSTGNISLAAAGSSANAAVDELAYAVGAGAATAGNITVGNVSLTGNTGASLNIVNGADELGKGNAEAGNVTVGNVHLATSGSGFAGIFDSAAAAGGLANVGNLTVGNISADVGASGSAAIHVESQAIGEDAADATGLVKIGNVDVVGASDALLTVDVFNNAGTKGDTGSAAISAVAGMGKTGGVSVGNVTLAVGASGSGNLNILDHGITAGNLSVGKVNVTAAAGAHVKIIAANGNATAGNFSVSNAVADVRAGNLMVGNVSMKAAASASILAHIGNYAEILSGNATVGNVTVGNVSLQGLPGVITLFLSNDAFLGKYNGKGVPATGAGNVAGGNMTVGNVSLHGSAFVAGFNQVDAYGVGSATVGNIHVGNIAAVATGISGGAFFIDLARAASNGNATAGDVTIGNVSLTGSGNPFNYFSAYLQAFAVGAAGDAKEGNISAGNITLTHIASVNTGGTERFELSNNVIASKGNATAGNVTVGNISINPGVASGVGQASVEDRIILYNTVQARAGGLATAGNITVGNVTGPVGLSGEFSFLADNEDVGKNTANKTGLVKVGNVDVDGAAGARALIDIYNVASTKLYKSTHSIISAAAAGAGAGIPGGISVGNVALTAGASGSAQLNVKEYGGSAGNVAVGNVSLNAPSIALEVLNDADAANAGNLKVGNITLKGNDSITPVTAVNASNANFVIDAAKSGSAGSVNVGNVSLSAGAGQTNALEIADEALSAVGDVTLGNVSLAVHNTNADTAVAKAALELLGTGSSDGNIKIGDIAAAATGVTTRAALGTANMEASLSAHSAQGSVTIGNVLVSGGVVGGGGHTLDNLGNLTGWLHLSSGSHATITVGNINYSGYAGGGDADTILDVSRWVGAAAIIGAQGGSTIDDNAGQNIINVSDTTKADNLYFSTTQTAVTDANVSAGTANQSAMDEIIGFHSGDTIAFTHGTLLGDDGAIAQSGAESWATFLSSAATDIHAGYDAYAALVTDNSYVALNYDNKVVEIVEVKGVHTFTDSNHTLHWAS
jgi:hypothetical protein